MEGSGIIYFTTVTSGEARCLFNGGLFYECPSPSQVKLIPFFCFRVVVLSESLDWPRMAVSPFGIQGLGIRGMVSISLPCLHKGTSEEEPTCIPPPTCMCSVVCGPSSQGLQVSRLSSIGTLPLSDVSLWPVRHPHTHVCSTGPSPLIPA